MTAYRIRPWYLRSALFPLVAGLAALGLGLAFGDAGTIVGIAITTAVAGPGWWLLVSRGRTNKLLAEVDAAAPPTEAVDLRDNPTGIGTYVLFAALAACGLLSPSVSGLLFGMALAHLADTLRLRTWERAHGSTIVATREGYTAVAATGAG